MATSWRAFAMPSFLRLRIVASSALLGVALMLVACGMSAAPATDANAANAVALHHSDRSPVLTIVFTADSKGYFDPCPT